MKPPTRFLEYWISLGIFSVVTLFPIRAYSSAPVTVAIDPTIKAALEVKPEPKLQIKAPEPVVEAKAVVVTPAVQTPSSGAVAGCGDNFYANFIYMHESGCKLRNPNGSGCDGIGQACPASKIYNACPNMDYECQNAFFTAYAGRYGGWAGSYAAWQTQHWW